MAPMTLRLHAAEAAAALDWAIEDADDVHLVEIVERVALACYEAALTERTEHTTRLVKTGQLLQQQAVSSSAT